MGERSSLATEKNKPLNWLQLEDPKAVDFISDPERRVVLGPFFEAPKSISEAAEEAGKPFRKMFYLVTKAVSLGLLEIIDMQKRKGRATKLYRCVADIFFVPYRLMKEDLRATWLEAELNYLPSQLDAAVHSHPLKSEAVIPNDEWGNVYTLSGQRIVISVNSNKRRFTNYLDYLDYLVLEHPKPYFNVIYKGMKLSPENAKAFQRELVDLAQKYQALAGEGAEHHIKLFIAQMPKET